MTNIIQYIFWPNPSTPSYMDPKVLVILSVCCILVIGSFAVRYWRKTLSNPITKKLSRSYGTAMLWLGIVGLFLIICRVEGISYLSMRLWWGVWIFVAAAYTAIQIKIFRTKHYEILPRETVREDPNEKYLPKKKKR